MKTIMPVELDLNSELLVIDPNSTTLSSNFTANCMVKWLKTRNERSQWLRKLHGVDELQIAR